MIILFGFQSDFILYPKLSWTVRLSTDGHSVECLCVIFQLARVWYQMRKRYFLLIKWVSLTFWKKISNGVNSELSFSVIFGESLRDLLDFCV